MAICKECGVAYTPKKKDQQFDKPACRKAWYAKNYFNREPVTLVCPVCQKSFETTKSGQQIYCDDPPGECRKIAQERMKFGLGVDTPLVGAGICEICGRGYKVRGKHNKVDMCQGCYNMAVRVDNGLAPKYMQLIAERTTTDDLWS
jgi:hypothetical protein